MPLLKDISPQIQMEELLKAQERGRGQAIGSRSFAVEEAAREAVLRLHALVAPALLYEVFPPLELHNQPGLQIGQRSGHHSYLNP